MEDGGFTLVKKGRRGSRPPAKPPGGGGGAGGAGFGFRYQQQPGSEAATSFAASLATVQQQLDAAVEQLERSRLWAELLAVLQPLPPVADVVCFGVGSFASSASARYQLAQRR